MRNRQEAEAKLRTVDLLRPVPVTELTEPETGRQRLRYQVADNVKIEMYADADPEEWTRLAQHLPVDPAKRLDAINKLGGPRSPRGTPSPQVGRG